MSESADPMGSGRRAQKSPEAFRTISEVAAELDVPQHVLRFWESKFSQVRPLKRAGGRRYYRPEDVLLLRRIRALLYSDGYTIKGVQKLLRESGVRALLESQPEVRETADGEPTPAGIRPDGNVDGEKRQQLRNALADLARARDLLSNFDR